MAPPPELAVSDTLVDLIRHGEPRGGRMIRGQAVDHPLGPLGWQQMRAAVGQEARWDQVIASPMARCREFACELAGRRGLPLAVEPELREIGMGAWEGLRPSELAAADPAGYADYLADPVDRRPPGGESLAAFLTRIAAAYDRQIAAYPGRRLLIVCHAGVSRAILGHLLQAAPLHWWRLRIDYAGVTRIRHGHHGSVIEYVNARRAR
jgi:probable phosphoglycerate mutase